MKIKNIADAEDMWHHFTDYKNWIKSHPVLVHDFVGKEGTEVDRKRERPLTMQGFQNFLDDCGIISDVTDYFENAGGKYADFIHVCKRIKRNITADQIEGGMTNIYNANITARLNGLIDKVQEDGTKKVIFEVTYADDKPQNNAE